MDLSPTIETTLLMAPTTSRHFNLPEQMEARYMALLFPFTYQHSTLTRSLLSRMIGEIPLQIPLRSEQMQGLSMSALHKSIPETLLIIRHVVMIPKHPSTRHPVSMTLSAKMTVFQRGTTLTWDLFPFLDMTKTILSPGSIAKTWETFHPLFLFLSKKGLELLMSLENRAVDMKTRHEGLLIDKIHVYATEIVPDLRSLIQADWIHVPTVIEENTLSIQNVHVIDIDAKWRAVAIHFPSHMGLTDICLASMGLKELCTAVQIQHAVSHSIGSLIWRDTTRTNIEALRGREEFLHHLSQGFNQYWQPSLSTLTLFLKYDKDYDDILPIFWELLAVFLNTFLDIHETPDRIRDEKFPLPERDEARPFPEDFAMRSLLWTEGYFSDQWFSNEKIYEEAKHFHLASMTAQRKERILWLGCRIASLPQQILNNSKQERQTLDADILELERCRRRVFQMRQTLMDQRRALRILRDKARDADDNFMRQVQYLTALDNVQDIDGINSCYQILVEARDELGDAEAAYNILECQLGDEEQSLHVKEEYFYRSMNISTSSVTELRERENLDDEQGDFYYLYPHFDDHVSSVQGFGVLPSTRHDYIYCAFSVCHIWAWIEACSEYRECAEPTKYDYVYLLFAFCVVLTSIHLISFLNYAFLYPP